MKMTIIVMGGRRIDAFIGLLSAIEHLSFVECLFSHTRSVFVLPFFPLHIPGLWSNWNNPRGSVECTTGNICFEY